MRTGTLLLALAVLFASAQADDATTGAAVEGPRVEWTMPDDERAALTTRLAEVRRLLTQIEVLQTQLSNQAQEALDRADAAPDLDERGRQERLYTEIGARIGQLRTTRRDLESQLDALEGRLR